MDELASHLQLYSCRATVLSFPNIEVESDDGSHLKWLDAVGPGGRILKMCTHVLPCQTVTNYSAICLKNLNKDFVEFMQQQRSGPGCSKLTTSLVNVSLKFQTLISNIRKYSLMKKCEKLLQCKSFSHFFNKKCYSM